MSMKALALYKRSFAVLICMLAFISLYQRFGYAQATLRFVSAEAEASTLTGNASVGDDDLAGRGAYLGFNAASQGLPGWELLYEDNFDGSTLNTTVLDPASKRSYWQPYNSPGHAGNGLRRPSAFTVENGNLVITAKSVLQPDGTKKTVSGGMSNVTDSIYGRFEARVRVEADPTGTMSGLVLTWPEAGNNCLNGELDFFETGHAANTRQPFYSYLHYPTADQVCTPTPQRQFVHNFDGTQWHKVVMEWTASSINVKVYSSPTGGAETLISDNTLTEDTTDKIPDVLHHMTIQLDAFKSAPLPDNVVVKQYVDYVRHYRKL